MTFVQRRKMSRDRLAEYRVSVVMATEGYAG